eukprot:3110961-Amphidinium_carterae.1
MGVGGGSWGSQGLSEYRPDVVRLRESLDDGVTRTQSYVKREQLLGLPVTDYFELDGMIDDYAPYYRLWDTVIQFQQSEITWTNEPVKSLKSTQIEALLDQWFKDVFKMIKSFDNPHMKGVRRKKSTQRNRTQRNFFKQKRKFKMIKKCLKSQEKCPQQWKEQKMGNARF